MAISRGKRASLPPPGGEALYLSESAATLFGSRANAKARAFTTQLVN